MYERTYHKSVLKTDEPSPKKKGHRRLNAKVIGWIALGIVIIVAAIFIVRLPNVQVTTVNVYGANVVDPGDVSEFVKTELQGKKLFVLPRSSIFILSTHQLATEIKAAFPRLQTVYVSRQNFSTVAVTVTEFKGVYLWCVDEATCYFMDQNGIVFANAPYFSGNAYPKLFNGPLYPLPFLGVTSKQLDTMTLLNTQLASLGIVPSEFHYNTDRDLEVYFSHNGQPSILRFDPSLDMNAEISALFTGLQTDPLATKYNDVTQVLQYIDLRFDDRVIYKFQ